MKEVKIKDICEKGSSNLKQKDVENKNGSYPVFGASGLIGHLDTYHQENSYIAIVKDGSGIGRVTFMPPQSSVIGTMQYILPKTDYDIKYIGYCLQSLDLSKYKQGAAIPHIYFRDYGEPEQKEIVEYLDSSFAKIDKLKENAAKNLEEAKALFQSALKDALEPKEGWIKSTFGDVCQYRKNNGIHKNLQYVGMEHIEQGNGRLIGTMDSNSILSTSFRFQKGDVLYGRLRPYLKKVYVAKFEGCCSTEIFPIYSNYIDASFLKYWLLTDITTTAINNTCSGCRMPRGNMNEVLKFIFSYPHLSEQMEIVKHLDSLNEKVNTLQQNYSRICNECDALKQAILRQVFE